MSHTRPKLTDFASRLKALREIRGLTQMEAAKSLKMCRSTYAYYEVGKTEPSLAQLRDMAIVYDVSTDYLLGLKNAEEEGIKPKQPDFWRTFPIQIGRRNT